jgi:uncharacterized phiE125 gp8 family phage protein
MIGGSAIRIVPPAAMPVTIAEIKSQCEYYENDKDAMLAGLARAAVEYVENYTGLALITQDWTQTYPAFPATKGALLLHRRPLQSVIFVDYLDISGTQLPLDVSVYRVSGIGQAMHPAALTLNTTQSWPTIYAAPEAVKITYRAGFGNTHNDVPEVIRQAILMTVATWFSFREDAALGDPPRELAFGSKAMLRDYRPLAVA